MPKLLEDCQAKDSERTNYRYDVTGKMMRLTYYELKLNIPIYHHKSLVTLLEQFGVDMGYHHYERRSAQRMGNHISDTMHKEFINFLKTDNSPISVMVDGATDASQNHYMCIFLQTIYENKPRVMFYRNPQLGSDETAEGLLKTMKDVFAKDGLTDVIKERLTAFVADGAAVNLGKKGGLAIKLEEFVGRKLIKVHCMAHRLNLAVRKVFTDKEEFNWVFHVESILKQVHTFFYNKGHKRKSLLREFMEGIRATFGGAFEIRWSAAEKKAIQNILKHYKPLVKSLEIMGKPNGPFAGSQHGNTRAQANGMVKTLADKNLVEILHYLMDILDALETSSLNFQKRYGILIDQGKNLKSLINELKKIGRYVGGTYIQKFLKTAKCGEQPCNNLRDYESFEEVTFKDTTLKIHSRHSVYPEISSVGQSIAKRLIEEILDWIPQETMDVFDVLNPFSLPDDSYPFGIGTQYRQNDIESLYLTIFENEASTKKEVEDELVKNDWNTLLEKITNDENYCKLKKSKDVIVFWQHYLGTNLMPERMKKLIRKVLAVPIGSADVERAFSVLSHIRTQRRSKLTAYHLEGLLRIRLNGPKVDMFSPLQYAKKWTGLLTDDPLQQRKKSTQKETQQDVPQPNVQNKPNVQDDLNLQERMEDEVEPIWNNEPDPEDADESEMTPDAKNTPEPEEFKYMNEFPLF